MALEGAKAIYLPNEPLKAMLIKTGLWACRNKKSAASQTKPYQLLF